MINHYLKFIFLSLIFISNSYSRDLCNTNNITIGFFNGVWNSPEDAEDSRKALEERIKGSKVDVDHSKVNYETFYNDTDGKGLDLLETYEQMLNELGDSLKTDNGEIRYEFFGDFINFGILFNNWEPLYNIGLEQSNLESNYPEILHSLKGLFGKTVSHFTVKYLNSKLDELSTDQNYEEHREQIDKLTNLTLIADKLLFVAHSQGNLYANKAFEYVKTKKGYENKEAVKLVHIAPASTKLNGDYVLVDMDIVINFLLLAYPGERFRANSYIYEQLPKVVIGALLTLEPAFQAYKLLGIYLLASTNYRQAKNELEQLFIDPMGHEFVKTYLNPNFRTLNDVLSKINNAVRTLEAPDIQEEEKVKSGFFSAILKWDGLGDVDLRVLEPDGTDVTAWNKKGNSGELDIDNRVGYGPEYYHASCDSDKLQTGIYQIRIANFGGFKECRPNQKNCKLPPPFRKATLLVESDYSGILMSQEIVLGNDNKSNRGFYMIDLLVAKSYLTNKYAVGVINMKPRLITNWVDGNKP